MQAFSQISLLQYLCQACARLRLINNLNWPLQQRRKIANVL